MADGGRRAPDWEWEEIVLVCDAVAQNQWQQLAEGNLQVIQLSELLQKMDLHPLDVRGDKFRNLNGVIRKSADIATARPGHQGGRTNGGRTTEEVVAEFIRNPEAMHALAESLRSSLTRGEQPDLPREVGYENEPEMEGRYLLRLHAYRERNPTLRRKKIRSVLADGGSLACEVCKFDFAHQYGERGQGYIECHHVEPLHIGGEKPRTVKDLALLCSNCHRMIHTKPPWPTPSELRELINRQPNALAQLDIRLEWRPTARGAQLVYWREYRDGDAGPGARPGDVLGAEGRGALYSHPPGGRLAHGCLDHALSAASLTLTVGTSRHPSRRRPSAVGLPTADPLRLRRAI